MAIAILRVKDGLDCSQLVGSLNPEHMMVKNDSQISLGGYENNGMEFDGTDPTANNGYEAPAGEKNHENIFGKKHTKSDDDLTSVGVYR